MRIISGKYKSKKIIPPVDKNTRPLRDIVKESIFNLIKHSNKFNLILENSNILDLFSGSGSFGLECLSRGAKKVIFVENYSKAISVLNKNIHNFQELNFCKIINRDCFHYINFDIKIDEKFDFRSPFKEEKINILIEKIKEKNFTKKWNINNSST